MAAEELPGSQQSYLEHVYPGIKRMLATQTPHVEIGRVALALTLSASTSLPDGLFRGGLLIAARSGFSILHGWSPTTISPTAMPLTEPLSALMRPPYRRTSPALPPPRHPINDIHPSDSTHLIGNVQALKLHRQEHNDNFRLPVLLRQYFNLMEAKVCNLSLARFQSDHRDPDGRRPFRSAEGSPLLFHRC